LIRSVAVLYEIADCVRMCFSCARNRRSAQTERRPRKTGRSSSSMSEGMQVWSMSKHCALRAPTAFSGRIKTIRPENAVMVNPKQGLRVLYKIADCVRMCFSSARNRRSARTGRRPRKDSHVKLFLGERNATQSA